MLPLTYPARADALLSSVSEFAVFWATLLLIRNIKPGLALCETATSFVLAFVPLVDRRFPYGASILETNTAVTS